MSNNVYAKDNLNKVKLNNDFVKLIVDQSFEVDQNDIENTSSTKGMKDLTINIMKDISDHADLNLMVTVAKRVNAWKRNEIPLWKKGLLSLARKYENITAIYLKQYKEKMEFIIIVKDILCDEVLAYNEFCFELLEDFPRIDNFYIFDETEYKDMHAEYTEFNNIFQRG